LGKNLPCGRDTTLVPGDGFTGNNHVDLSRRKVDSGLASAIQR
jgi:hypothetical protein